MDKQTRQQIKRAKRWVVKIGSSLLTKEGEGLDETAIKKFVDQIERLLKEGKEIVLVSSGAVAAGVSCLDMQKRPEKVHLLQAAAAVGQMSLVQAYEAGFKQYERQTAQILLTHDDLSDRKRYLNARSTILALIDLGVVSVINENDTVVTDEIRFGDNDNLAALVANLIQADVMLILTNQDGMFEKDPREDPKAKIIEECKASDQKLKSMATGSKDGLGRGGMITKVQSAVLASRSGAHTIIANGKEANIIEKILAGEATGTLLYSEEDSLSSRKQWLASHLQMSGQIVIDEGAEKVLKGKTSSLLGVGVVEVKGEFYRGDMVECIGLSGNSVARGLVNYSSDEARQIAGKASHEIEQTLGYVDEPELINRDNLVLT